MKHMNVIWCIALVAVVLCMIYLEKKNPAVTAGSFRTSSFETEESDTVGQSNLNTSGNTSSAGVNESEHSGQLNSEEVQESKVDYRDNQQTNIRVLLCTSQYTSKVHSKVSVTSESAFKLTAGDSIYTFSPGDVVDIDAQSTYLATGQAVISIDNDTDVDSKNLSDVGSTGSKSLDVLRETQFETQAPMQSGIQLKSQSQAGTDARLTVLSIQRSYGCPSYRGKLIITRRGDSVSIVNELPLEEYLYGVVPSEMPASYDIEALKAQAVCARCFAYTTLNSTKFADYGADLDDSTASQVYMNQAEDIKANQAVDDTKDMLLYYRDEIARTYFYSTSCGVTSDVEDVWGAGSTKHGAENMTNETDSKNADENTDGTMDTKYAGKGDSESEDDGYLIPVFIQLRANSDAAVPTLAAQSKDLSEEWQFRDFINMSDTSAYYEHANAWFRWQVYVPCNNLLNSIANVSSAYKTGQINGTLTGIEVGERGTSGIVKFLNIYSSNGTMTIYGEYSIRKVLNISGQTITCADGTKVTNQTMLPSAYFYIEAANQGWVLHGGGFGHGVGLSQNGAEAMSEDGLNYEDILAYFYPNTQLESVHRSD